VDGEINYVGFAAPNAQELAHQLPETLKHHPAYRKLDSDS
jgi:hypothetical protein